MTSELKGYKEKIICLLGLVKKKLPKTKLIFPYRFLIFTSESLESIATEM